MLNHEMQREKSESMSSELSFETFDPNPDSSLNEKSSILDNSTKKGLDTSDHHDPHVFPTSPPPQVSALEQARKSVKQIEESLEKDENDYPQIQFEEASSPSPKATAPKKEEKKQSTYVLSPTWKEKHMQLNYEKMERRRIKKT